MRHGSAEGESPLPSGSIGEGQVAFDLVYVPEETPFLVDAAAPGAVAIGGLDMLVPQGAASFPVWPGHAPPLGGKFPAARGSLAQRERPTESRGSRATGTTAPTGIGRAPF